MQKTDSNHSARNSHRRVKSSTTLSRKYVKRPAKETDVPVTIKRSPKIAKFNTSYQDEWQNNKEVQLGDGEQVPVAILNNNIEVSQPREQVEQPAVHPLQQVANDRVRQRNNIQITEVEKPIAKELKDQAIQKALASASQSTEEVQPKKIRKTTFGNNGGLHFSFGKVALAFACTVAVVFAVVFYLNMSMPDISLRVAAMQTGIEASYPNYIPRDFSLSDITSENGKITLNFKNSSINSSFTLIEEKSSWDSNALLTNYVKDEYGDDYTVVREQGITIYTNDTESTWVNGGIFYKIHINSGSLTKKQIRSIAVSL